MPHSKNEDFPGIHAVENRIGKPPEKVSPNIYTNNRPTIRSFEDFSKGFVDCIEKISTQSSHLFLIIESRIKDFGLGFVQ